MGSLKVECHVVTQNEVFRLKADCAAKDSRLGGMERVQAENALLKDKVMSLRSVLLTARETLTELPKLQETCGRLEQENMALRAAQDLQVCSVHYDFGCG